MLQQWNFFITYQLVRDLRVPAIWHFLVVVREKVNHFILWILSRNNRMVFKNILTSLLLFIKGLDVKWGAINSNKKKRVKLRLKMAQRSEMTGLCRPVWGSSGWEWLFLTPGHHVVHSTGVFVVGGHCFLPDAFHIHSLQHFPSLPFLLTQSLSLPSRLLPAFNVEILQYFHVSHWPHSLAHSLVHVCRGWGIAKWLHCCATET